MKKLKMIKEDLEIRLQDKGIDEKQYQELLKDISDSDMMQDCQTQEDISNLVSLFVSEQE